MLVADRANGGAWGLRAQTVEFVAQPASWRPASANGPPFKPAGHLPSLYRSLTPREFMSPQGQALSADLPFAAVPATDIDRAAHQAASRLLASVNPPPSHRLARDFISHFLTGDGSPKTVPASALDRIARNFVTGQIARLSNHSVPDEIVEDVRKHAQSSGGQKGQVKGLTRWISVSDGDLNGALGWFAMKVSYIADYSRRPDGQFDIAVRAVPQIQDVYDFARNGLSIPVSGLRASHVSGFPDEYRRWLSVDRQDGSGARTTIRDDLFAELQLRGLARPFAVVGVGNPIRFSITTGGGWGGNRVRF